MDGLYCTGLHSPYIQSIYIYFCKSTCVTLGHAARVDLGEQLSGVYSLLPCVFLRLDPSHWTWQVSTYLLNHLAGSYSSVFVMKEYWILLFFCMYWDNHTLFTLTVYECALSCSLISIYYDLLLWVRNVSSSRWVNKSRFELRVCCTAFWRVDI